MKQFLFILLLTSCASVSQIDERSVDIKIYKPSKEGLIRNEKVIKYSDLSQTKYYCVSDEDWVEIYKTIKGYNDN